MPLNLSKPPYPMHGPFDVIFCRNVMIYFDAIVRKNLVSEMSRLIKPSEYLMVGHSESLAGMDSETVRAMLVKTIELASIPVGELFKASNGKEALTILATHWIDLVLTDIHMPVMDGIEMIDQMVNNEILSSVPVIIISTDEKASHIESQKSKDVKGYITKPFSPRMIKKVVEDVISGRHVD